MGNLTEGIRILLIHKESVDTSSSKEIDNEQFLKLVIFFTHAFGNLLGTLTFDMYSVFASPFKFAKEYQRMNNNTSNWIAQFRKIAASLRTLGPIKTRHVEVLLNRIIKEKAGTLTPEHKQFLAEVAAIFVS